MLKVRMSRELAETLLAGRDAQGFRLSIVWGEPDAEGFYTPTVFRDWTDNIATDAYQWAADERPYWTGSRAVRGVLHRLVQAIRRRRW